MKKRHFRQKCYYIKCDKNIKNNLYQITFYLQRFNTALEANMLRVSELHTDRHSEL